MVNGMNTKKGEDHGRLLAVGHVACAQVGSSLERRGDGFFTLSVLPEDLASLLLKKLRNGVTDLSPCMGMSTISHWTTGLLVLGVCSLLGMAVPSPSIIEKGQADLEVFVRKGCPHCESAKRFLIELGEEYPDLHITYHDVEEDLDARDRLLQLGKQFDVQHIGVPAFWVKGTFIVGFSSKETTGQRLKALLGRPPPSHSQNKNDGVCGLEDPESCSGPQGIPPSHVVHVPFLGAQNFSDLGLPLFTLLLGVLDGFNPCAMWVLLFLLSLLATLRDRKQMAWLAATFVVMSGVVYFMLMTAWLQLFFLIGYARLTQVVLGSVAGVVGFINVKDFFAFRKGVTLAIPESAKPAFYERLRRILYAQHHAAAFGGIVILAFVVNLFELVCTAGFPALYTQILSQQSLDWWAYTATSGYIMWPILRMMRSWCPSAW